MQICTLNGAKLLRLDHRLGSIDAGKDADLAIWTGHPFSTYSRVESTFVDGEMLFDRQKDLQMRKELAKEKADRLKKEADDEAKKKKSGPEAKKPEETEE